MSRIGRLPITVPAGVTVEIAENNKVTVKGPKGTLEKELPVEMEIKQEGESDRRNKTERSEENEISPWSDKNTDQQHGCRCDRRIQKGSGSQRCWLQSCKSRKIS